MKLPLLVLVGVWLPVTCAVRVPLMTVMDAVARAKAIITARRDSSDRFNALGTRAPSTSHMLRMTRVLDDQTVSNRANLLLMTSQLLMSDGFSLAELRTPEVTLELTALIDGHTSARTACDPSSPYRTADGSCNNLGNPEWGKAGAVQRRVIPADYADTLSSPRAFSVTGATVALPNPRTVSNAVHKALPPGQAVRMKTYTLHMMAMGQFLDHDIILTPHADVVGCCSDNKDEECFPLTVEMADDTFPAGYCMDVSRSAAFTSSCQLDVRQQGNAVTSYIDASQVYGSSDKEMALLRETGTGLLRTASPNRLPDNPDGHCRLSDASHSCSLAGDTRVNEVPTLTSYHTMFVREHNRIATEMSARISDAERVFQETRRLVIAEIQHIVYSEFLPTVLSPAAMATHGLEAGSYEYNSSVDATVTNGFGIAYRFGHTWIPNAMNLFKRKLKVSKRGRLKDNFHTPALTYARSGLERITYWLSGDRVPGSHRVVERSVRDLLFLDDQGDSFDLAALNIHRGRDHGVPSYYSYRKWCGLPDADSFTTGAGGLVHHDADSVTRLSSVYVDPRDIDLWTGVLTETPVSGGMVGPTLECILGRQFRALKFGDRFWFEGEAANFTQEQIAEIKKASLARVLCDNMNFKTIQKNAFKVRWKTNCENIEGMDLTKFGAGSR